MITKFAVRRPVRQRRAVVDESGGATVAMQECCMTDEDFGGGFKDSRSPELERAVPPKTAGVSRGPSRGPRGICDM
jgi:hypothetical protein